MISGKKVAFHTLGCKVNIYETVAMEEMVKNAGCTVVDFSEFADIYIINTCSVTNIADKKSRQMLHRAKKENPNAVIVAVGCYVQSAYEDLKKDNNIDILIGNNKKSEIVNILNEYFTDEYNKIKLEYVNDISKDNSFEQLKISEAGNYTRAFLKIQDGCNQFCSYCIIPYTRGRIRSRDIDDIISEAKKLVESGYKEIVLTGIHLSSYGDDLNYDVNLADVIKALGEIKGLKRIRIGSLEPKLISEDFLNKIKAIASFCPHFHLSLQSGSDKILKLMNRKYGTEEFYHAVELIRKYFKHPAITTDIIVGFPGESDDDFNESFDFIKSINFYETHIFPYSKREGTRAAKFSGQLSNEIKSKRVKILLDLNKKNKIKFSDEIFGEECEILLEDEISIDGINYIRGYTKEYIRIAVIKNDKKQGDIIRGKVVKRLEEDLLYME